MTRMPFKKAPSADYSTDGLEYCLGSCRTPAKTLAVAERVARCSSDPDARELAYLVKAILKGQTDQLVSRAFGHKGRGGESETRRAGRSRRDRALRLLAAAEKAERGDLGQFEIAAHVVTRTRRYELTRWKQDRKRGTPRVASDSLFFAILKDGHPIPSKRTVANILKNMNS
jgi:hypothetical protein